MKTQGIDTGINSKKVVLTYGTFDLFHIGHLRLLERLRELGDYLIVGISTDKFNELKGKRTIIPFSNRAEIVRSITYVDQVIEEYSWDQKVDDVVNYGVDIFGIGDDWKGKFDDLNEHCQVVYLPRTDAVSTSSLKSSLELLDRDHISQLKQALDIISDLIEKFD